MKIYTYLLISILVLLTRADLANADQIYKWTDPAGLTHYSETPPVTLDDGADIPVDTLGIRLSGYPSEPGKDDYYSIVNQAKRMEESRLKQEQLRIEREAHNLAKQDAYTKSQPVQVVIEQPSYPVYSSPTVFYPHRSRHRTKHGHRPQRTQAARLSTGLGNSPALQIRAYSGKVSNTTAGLQLSFE